MTAALIEDLKARGLLNQATADEELVEHLQQGCRTLYCGFDPTQTAYTSVLWYRC